ncbi:MAG: MBL fold metallo-hydrolase [Deltaproteobacteria bacterium]|nr:MBL fold metallo-hydrolase [Deltaproteobacteria bacterium]
MIEEIATDLYRVEIPLPDLPLEFVNSYIIKDGSRHLIVDTGMYHDKCLNAMQAAMNQLCIDPKKTDYFITHSHGDHIGLVYKLIQTGSIVYINQLEVETISKIRTGVFMSESANFLRMSGFPEKDPEKIIPARATREFKSRETLPFIFVEDGDTIEIGAYRFTCVKTPGHSKGHICLYETEKKLLIAGDHLLKKITPGIQARLDGDNPLKKYLSSLDKIGQLYVETVLPGHGVIFGDGKKRIEEIKEHHSERNREVLSILKSGSRNIYEITALMRWNTDCSSWDSTPLIERYWATGEAFAHLVYLEEMGKISKIMKGEEAFYSICGNNAAGNFHSSRKEAEVTSK